jgi:c-di-GMP-binding flagellar brake protein YcgR
VGRQDGSDVRGHPRIRVMLKVAIFGAGPGPEEVAMTTIDLSVGGMLCQSEQTLPLARPYKLRLELVDDSGAVRPVVLEAIVLRVEGTGPFRIAFHFLALPSRVLERLRRLVLQTLKEAGA